VMKVPSSPHHLNSSPVRTLRVPCKWRWSDDAMFGHWTRRMTWIGRRRFQFGCWCASLGVGSRIFGISWRWLTARGRGMGRFLQNHQFLQLQILEQWFSEE
jgi:hypothetical protein